MGQMDDISVHFLFFSLKTSAYVVEEEIKEQQRRKQESLRHFQRQVRHRVNQWVMLRKKQQLHKSYKAVSSEVRRREWTRCEAVAPSLFDAGC